MRDTSYFLVTITQENCKNFSLLNIDAKLVWLLNNENIHESNAFIYRGHQGPVPKGHLDWK
jgi:hypothetical protein